MSVTRTSEAGPSGLSIVKPVRALILGALVGLGVTMACAPAALAQTSRSQAGKVPAGKAQAVPRGGITFTSPEVAYDHGRSALQAGHPEIAIQAFEYAAENDVFLAQFFLARTYADNAISFTNHGRAFDLYQQIVTEYAEVDVDDDPRAPFVAKAMVALAQYYRNGLAEAGVAPDAEQAANLLRNAAKTFRDEDAQYEYAKILLTGDGAPADPREAVYWLRGLSTRGHTSAQALLADLYWRGTHVKRDPTQALLLITLAAENAPAADRVWIEDKYQNIFCGAGEGVRQQAQGAVADWRSKYGRSRDEKMSRDGLATIQPRAQRTCSNGEVAVPQRRGETPPAVDLPPPPRNDLSAGLRPAAPQSSGSAFAPGTGSFTPGTGFMQGSSMGFSLQDAGQTTTTLVPPPR